MEEAEEKEEVEEEMEGGEPIKIGFTTLTRFKFS